MPPRIWGTINKTGGQQGGFTGWSDDSMKGRENKMILCLDIPLAISFPNSFYVDPQLFHSSKGFFLPPPHSPQK